jgi:hypothetical protein
VFGVSGKIIPEMLEIDPLSATHQREWRFAVEMEMPQVPHQPHITPVPDAWQESTTFVVASP